MLVVCSLPVIRCQYAYVTVDGSDYDCANHHEPISDGNIDLPMEGGAGVSGLDLWEIGRVHELYQQLESAGDECLRSNNGSKNRNDKRWIEHARGYSLEERVCVCRWLP